jgi:hypothetical protein
VFCSLGEDVFLQAEWDLVGLSVYHIPVDKIRSNCIFVIWVKSGQVGFFSQVTFL